MHIAIWIIAALALALWSLLAWGAATLLGLDPAWVGEIRPWLDKLPFAAWLGDYVPGWKDLAVSLLDLTRALLGWVGSAAVWIVWALWGAGALLVVGTAAVLSLIVKLMAKVPTPASQSARPAH